MTLSSLFPSHVASPECESPSQAAETQAEGHTRFGSTSYLVQAARRKDSTEPLTCSPASGHGLLLLLNVTWVEGGHTAQASLALSASPPALASSPAPASPGCACRGCRPGTRAPTCQTQATSERTGSPCTRGRASGTGLGLLHLEAADGGRRAQLSGEPIPRGLRFSAEQTHHAGG